jgi:signal transduction histidine kinase
MPETAKEIRRYRRCLSDLIQLGSLSAIWSVHEPSSIVAVLLDALVAMLDLDFAYVRLIESIAGAPAETAMAGGASHQPLAPVNARDIGVALDQWLTPEHGTPHAVVPHPFGAGNVSIVTVSLGVPGALGVLLAASSRVAFPTVFERLLLRVAANEAAVALEESRHLDILLRKEAANATLAERIRVAGEVHDTLLQGFTGVTLQLQGAVQRWAVDGRKEAADELSRVLVLADETLREARDAVWDMRASEIGQGDFAGALEAAVRRAIGASPTHLQFVITGERRPLAPASQMALVRIAREAAFNAVKHAQPPTIDVHLSYEPSSVRLDVRDDGRGLTSGDVDAAASTGHWGVAGMRERARRAGGTLEISGAPGQGTALSVRIPTESHLLELTS